VATPEILHSTISTTRSAARCTCMIPTHRLRSIFNMDHPNSPNEVLHNPYLQSDSIASPAYATSHSFPRLSPAPIRPQIRIITSLPPPILRPIPTRQPALIKSAPLRVPPSPDAPGPPLKAADREAAILSAGGKGTVQVFSPPLKPSPEVRVHRRRFSEKFKSLFSHLHVWRELPTKSEAVMMLHDAPDRPHRSPGTRPSSSLAAQTSVCLARPGRPPTSQSHQGRPGRRYSSLSAPDQLVRLGRQRSG